MAVALPRVTRQQLKERERDWYNSGAVMSRSQGGHGRPAEALQPVKYMLEQTCITLSKAEAKLSGGNMIEDGYGGGGGGLPRSGRPEAAAADMVEAAATGAPVIRLLRRHGGGGGGYGSSIPADPYGGDANDPFSAPPGGGGGGGGYFGSSGGGGGYGSSGGGYGGGAPSYGKQVSFKAEEMMQKTRTAPVIANDGKGNRRVSLSMTAQQRAKINQENVNRITHRLEEIHDEMHELDDIIFFVEHSELVKVIMRVMMGRVKILLAKAWSQWAGDCNTMVGFADPREIKN